jgi:hypothetical protein
MKEIQEALREAAAKKQVMALYRDDTGECWSGVPVMVGPRLAVLCRERDFALDGYLAVDMERLTGVERYDDNDFVRRAMAGEGVYDGCRKPPIQGCGDWKQLLDGVIKAFGGWCIAQCEDEDGDLCLYVGKAASLRDNGLTLRPVDADGRWHQETVPIPYEDLRTLSFGGNYLRVFKKYGG